MTDGILRRGPVQPVKRLKDAGGGAVATVVTITTRTPLPKENDRLLQDDKGFKRRLRNMGDGTYAEVIYGK